MRRKFLNPSNYTYIALTILFLFCMSFSKTTVEKMRGAVVSLFSPFWQGLNNGYFAVKALFEPTQEKHFRLIKGIETPLDQELERLQLENQQLKNTLHLFQELEENVGEYNQMASPSSLLSKKWVQLIDLQPKAIPANIIYRSPASWNSFFWINAGEVDNAHLDFQVIAKNSPVVLGTSLVGVIDYVGKRQSRVRLITDSGLTPSVRAARGGEQNRLLIESTDKIMKALQKRTDLMPGADQKKGILENLRQLKQVLTKNTPSLYLAKGELNGSNSSHWRLKSNVLKGVGFNYDYADEEGPSRDLRTGKPLNDSSIADTIPILSVHDLLITTGMDGIFPPGLSVAEVTKIQILREGDYFYELQAIPTAGNLHDLSIVFILPPLGYDKTEQPIPFPIPRTD